MLISMSIDNLYRILWWSIMKANFIITMHNVHDTIVVALNCIFISPYNSVCELNSGGKHDKTNTTLECTSATLIVSVLIELSVSGVCSILKLGCQCSGNQIFA